MNSASQQPLIGTAAPVFSAGGRPKLLALLAVGVLAGAGWLYLGAMIAGMAGKGATLGPGMGLIDLLGRPDALSQLLYQTLCRPTFGIAVTASSGVSDALLLFAMWAAMVLAMMLPTAGGMIMSYAAMAAAARAKGERTVSPLVLIAGYVSVWLAVAVVASGMQIALTRAALLDPTMVAVSPLFSGAIFVGAGLYQFSALKHACVTLCQRPFPFFLANRSDEATGVYRLGLRQGAYCLGCCWAMMLVMFAVGVMNIVWMAALGIVMALEKISATTRFSRAIGVVLIAIGAGFILAAVAAHWPTT